MGLWEWLSGSGWSRKSPQLLDALKLFSEDEIQRIQQLFERHGCPADYTTPIDAALLQQLCGLSHASSKDVSAGLLFAIRRCSPTGQLTPEAVVVAKARLERSGDEAAMAMCFEILGGGAAAVARGHLERLLRGCLELVYHYNSLPGGLSEAAVSALALGALQAAAPGSSGGGGGGGGGAAALACAPAAESLGPGGYAAWCKSQPAVQHLLSSLLLAIGQPPPTSPAAAALPTFVSGCSRMPRACLAVPGSSPCASCRGSLSACVPGAAWGSPPAPRRLPTRAARPGQARPGPERWRRRRRWAPQAAAAAAACPAACWSRPGRGRCRAACHRTSGGSGSCCSPQGGTGRASAR
jgi:hypothetical protein